MKNLIIALVLALAATGPAAATPQSDVLAAVNLFMDSFNKGDTKAAIAACTDEMSIIDEFPPYEWHGPGAMSKWLGDYDADARKKGIADGIVTLGKARQVDVQGDHGYVVTTATYAYKKNGKPVQEPGAVFTFTLTKVQAGWKISGWAYAKH